MLNLITGEKGSGKTSYAHKIAGEAASRGERVMLIVPRQYSFETDRSILSLLGPRLASEIEVLSFRRLCDEAQKSCGSVNRPLAASGIKSILMSLAVEAVSENLTVYAKHKNDIALSQKLLSSVEEMKNSGVTREELLSCAASQQDKLLKDKIKETVLIFDAYGVLLEEGYFDEADLLSHVAESLLKTDFFDGRTVIIDGYSSFSSAELKMIEVMLRKAKQVWVTLCLREDTDVSDMSPFALPAKTLRRLRLLAGNNGVPVGDITLTCRKRAYPDDLAYLEKNIFSLSPLPFEGECRNIVLTASNTVEAECEAAARKIKAMIRKGEYRCRDIAVVFRSEGAYEKSIRLAFRKYGVPYFEDKRQPVINQPLISFASALLDIASAGFTTESIFRYLKTGLAGFTQEEITALENYVYAWDIDGRKWLSEWTDNPDGFGVELDEKRKARLGALNGIRKRAVEPLAAFREAAEGASGRELASALYFYLTENGVDEELKKYAVYLEEKAMTELALEQEQVWDILMESLDELSRTVGDRVITAKRFYELFMLCIHSKSLGKVPDGFDEVTVCPAQRILTVSRKVVFAVGMNNGVFPMHRGESGVFSLREKLKLAQGGIEAVNDSRDQQLFERFLAYNTLSCATDKLYLSYCLSDARDQALAESEYIGSVKALFPALKESFSSDASLEELIESEQSAFEIMAKNWNSDRPEIKALKEYFSTREEYAGRIVTIKRAVEKRNLSFESRENALEFFGRNLYFSATQLDDYGLCPFMYFCRHGLKAYPRLKAKFDPAQTGTAIHYVLECLLQKFRGKEFLSLSAEELDGEISCLLNEYLESSLSGSENKTERFNYLYFRMHRIISDILARLQGEFCESDFEPCDFELSIDREGDVQPFTVELREGKVDFCGKIDRIDKLDTEGKRYIRVVDYKTGIKDFKLNDAMNGINMQMLLYLVSIWRNGRGFYEGITPAGVLYFPARVDTVRSDRESDEADRMRTRYQNNRMKGLLLDDEAIIRRMDKKGEGLFLPVKFDSKTGQIKGNLISLEALGRLAVRMDGIIRDMGNSLHEGKVEARPLMGGGHTNTCLYCKYGDICMQEKPRYRFIETESHSECIKKLMEEDENEQKLD
ncbi:MAG: exodeoxyribonuclease V subunit gamma [Clostridia bacterium]|nr:exodeoxyribonuclease V subunit gamma [Clostridia bacterium]